MSALSAPSRPARPTGSPPAAARFSRPGWRDPRLVVGILLVCLSVVLGARLLGAPDDVTHVWAVEEAVAAGRSVSDEQLRPVGVRFADAGDAARYLSAADPLPEGTVVTRDLAAGELLPLSAISQGSGDVLELPIAVAGAGVPATLVAGDRVDVWSVPMARTTTRAPRGDLVLRDVPVLRVGGRGLGGAEATRQVVIGVDAATDLTGVVGKLTDTHVVLVRRP